MGGETAPRRPRKGEEHPASKLNHAKVAAIRHKHKHDGATLRSLAREYEVSPSTIRDIVRGLTWLRTTGEYIEAARTPEQRAEDPALATRGVYVKGAMPPLSMLDPVAYWNSPEGKAEAARREAEGPAFPDDPSQPHPPPRRMLNLEDDVYIPEDVEDEVCDQRTYDHRRFWYEWQQTHGRVAPEDGSDPFNNLQQPQRRSPLL